MLCRKGFRGFPYLRVRFLRAVRVRFLQKVLPAGFPGCPFLTRVPRAVRAQVLPVVCRKGFRGFPYLRVRFPQEAALPFPMAYPPVPPKVFQFHLLQVLFLPAVPVISLLRFLQVVPVRIPESVSLPKLQVLLFRVHF